MANVKDALYSRLTGFAGLATLIGTRVYPGSAPQGALYPLISYARISTPRALAMGVDPMLAWPRFQLTVLAKQGNVSAVQAAEDVMDQVRLALRRFHGTVAGVAIQDIELLDENDIEVPDQLIHGVALDIMIVHGE